MGENILQLKGGNKYNPSSITKFDDGMFELKYFGVGVNFNMRGNAAAMLGYALDIVSAVQSDLPQWIVWLRSAIKGELYRCKSGAIASETVCTDWQGGVDHKIEEAEISEFVVAELNMLNDVDTIKNFVVQ